jgi:hypothetical protein
MSLIVPKRTFALAGISLKVAVQMSVIDFTRAYKGSVLSPVVHQSDDQLTTIALEQGRHGRLEIHGYQLVVLRHPDPEVLRGYRRGGQFRFNQLYRWWEIASNVPKC